MSYIGLAVGVIVALALLSLIIRLLRADKTEARRAAARAPSIVDALLGRTRSRQDWRPDAIVGSGMVFNRKKGRLEVSARLTRETLDRAFPR